MADQNPSSSSGIDHLIYASASLERGMDEIEQLLGIRPVVGGRHPQYGTHNAQLSLGPMTYLEIIARDPDLPAPERGVLVDMPATSDSRLITWVFRDDSIEALAESARAAGVALGDVATGMREKPDGSQVTWRLTDPYAMPMGGAIPFLISWGDTVHPASVVPSGGQLIDLCIEHPDADVVRLALSALGADVKVIQSAEYQMIATIRTRNGLVTLKGW